MTDKRHGKPSASQFNRLLNCPGSWQAEQHIPAEDGGPDAVTGTLIHDAIARQDIESLADEHRAVAYECVQIRDEIVRDFGGDPQAGQYFVEIERRIWWRLKLFSGQCDYVVIDGPRALIVDYKTGHVGAPPAERNLQLAAYALLIAHEYGCDEIHVAIVQPRAFPRKSVSVYRWADIQAAEEAVTKMLHNAMAESPPRNAGEWCHYCRARATCPEAQSVVKHLVSIAETGQLPATTPEEMAQLLDRATIAKRIAQTIFDQAKERMIAGEEIPGYRLKPGSKRKTITDPNAVFTRAAERGITQEQFLAAVSVSTGKLKGALREQGLKGKAVDEAMEAIIDGLTEITETQPSIEKIK